MPPPPPPGGPSLDRSLTVGDVIEAMFRLLRETFGTVAAVAAILLFPGLVLLFGSLTQLEGLSGFLDPTVVTTPETTFETSVEPLFGVLLGLGALLSIIGSAAAVPGTMQVGVDHWNERKPSVGRALATGFRRMWGIVVVWFTLAIPWIVLLLVPGLWAIGVESPGPLGLYVLVLPVVFAAVLVVILYGYLVPAAVVAEDIGAWRALRRVRTLLRGNFWPTFGRGLLVGFLLGIINSVLSFASGLFGFLPPEVILVLTVLVYLVSYLVMTPLGNYGGLALYGDLRIRAEGADVLAMASRLRG